MPHQLRKTTFKSFKERYYYCYLDNERNSEYEKQRGKGSVGLMPLRRFMKPFIYGQLDAYIGILIERLWLQRTTGIAVVTSRAEYRYLLRHLFSARLRLTEKGHSGLGRRTLCREPSKTEAIEAEIKHVVITIRLTEITGATEKGSRITKAASF